MSSKSTSKDRVTASKKEKRERERGDNTGPLTPARVKRARQESTGGKGAMRDGNTRRRSSANKETKENP